MLVGLMLVFVTSRPDIIAVVSPLAIFVLATGISIVGMMGFFMPPPPEEAVAVPLEPVDGSAAMRRYRGTRSAKVD
jgi:hypothetical protein